MLNLRKRECSHEDLFVGRYGTLLGWSKRLTGNDKELAEDLVQEAFIQFTRSRPDLGSIHNLDAYLYGMLRNLNLSRTRRASRTRLMPLIDYDCAELGIRQADPLARIQLQDEIRSICEYLCKRKETSKTASVLILRFFHGYYPNEIGRVVNCSRAAVDDWIRLGRHETRLYLQKPSQLRFLRRVPKAASAPRRSGGDSDFWEGLADYIFRARSGSCLSAAELRELYQPSAAAVACKTLAHIVSCLGCLEAVNHTLGLSPLSQRFPTDMTGCGPRAGGGAPSAQDSDPPQEFEDACRRHSKQISEHVPQQLLVSVNGFVVGSQLLNGTFSEQTLSISIGEAVGFVEVLSEQGVRLVFLSVSPPPEGPVEQAARVDLSDGRELEISLTFEEVWPTVRAAYRAAQCGPAAIERPAEIIGPAEAPERPQIEYDNAAQLVLWRSNLLASTRRIVLSWAAGLVAWLRQGLREGLRQALRPGAITALFAVVLIAAMVLLQTRPVPVSAANLLIRADNSEKKLTGGAGILIHRSYVLESRQRDEKVLTSRRRVEVWSSADRELEARRLYDESGRLIAGEWTEGKEGRRTAYRSGYAPAVTPEASGLALRPDEIWLLNPSSRDFRSIIEGGPAPGVIDRPDCYIISYDCGESCSTSRHPEVLSASLTIKKADSSIREEVLVVKEEGSVCEYSFTEPSLERRPPGSAPSRTFIPDPELVSTSRGGRVPVVGGYAPGSETAPVAPAWAATWEAQIEVLYVFHQAGECLRDQISFDREDGKLIIRAIVDSGRRKLSLAEALKPLEARGLVTAEIDTLQEAAAKQIKLAPRPVSTRRIEITAVQIPAYVRLHSYFSGDREPGELGPEASHRIDEEIRRLSGRVMDRARLALRHAFELKHLCGMISPEDMDRLDSGALVKWRSMWGDHLRAFRQETAALRIELQPVFFGAAPSENEDAVNVSDVRSAAEQLFELATLHEEAIRSTFAVSNIRQPSPLAQTELFWRSLRRAERLAERMLVESHR
jgi:RNA polymerase sigma factor (sigma-70 family)